MADDKKDDDKKDGGGAAGTIEDAIFWIIVVAIGYGIVSNLIGYSRGEGGFGDTRVGRFLNEQFGFGSGAATDETLPGGIPVDLNGDGIVDGYTVEGRRGLVGVDNDGDGIIDEYVDQGEVGQQSLYRRFMADPSWSNFFRIIRTTSWLWNFVIWGQIILYGIALGFFILIWYLARKRQEIDGQQSKLGQVVNPLAVLVLKEKGHYIPDEDDDATKRWKAIQIKIASDIPDGWKTAILEADIMLEELLDMNGYHGASIGDKLKAVDPADFTTLNQAWEAHKIRNAIAHEGEGFVLTPREARRVIGLYEAVFKEFSII